jgi:hypothetical protein
MKVKELIAKLQKCDENMMVVVRIGYEGGYNEAKITEILKVKEQENPQWYEGKYDDCSKGEEGTAVLHIF